MSPSRRRGRRVPPKHGARPFPPLPAPTGPVADAGAESGGGGTTDAMLRATRSQNRAAKRATTGVRPKAVRGRASGRQSRGFSPVVLGLAVAAIGVVAAVFLLGNPLGTAAPSPSASGAATLGAATAATYGDGTCPTSQPASLAPGEKRTVTIDTAKGKIVIEVDGSRAPIATGNFVALVACKYYDGVVFHRLVPGFVIQGGDPDGTGSGPGPGYTIKDDPLVGTYKRGTVAMARTGQPNSQGSQFFIILSDNANSALTNPQLAPYPYAILGEVTSGMEVADAIAAMPNSGDNNGNQALDPVVMTSVTVAPATTPSPSPAGSAPAPSASPTATQ